MQKQVWSIGILLMIAGGIIAWANQADAGPKPDQIRATNSNEDFVTNVQSALQSTWDLGGSVGEIITEFGQTAPNCLGFLSCLVLPLAWLGVWTLTNLPRILGLITFRDNVRSFFRD